MLRVKWNPMESILLDILMLSQSMLRGLIKSLVYRHPIIVGRKTRNVECRMHNLLIITAGRRFLGSSRARGSAYRPSTYSRGGSAARRVRRKTAGADGWRRGTQHANDAVPSADLSPFKNGRFNYAGRRLLRKRRAADRPARFPSRSAGSAPRPGAGDRTKTKM